MTNDFRTCAFWPDERKCEKPPHQFYVWKTGYLKDRIFGRCVDHYVVTVHTVVICRLTLAEAEVMDVMVS